MTALHNQYSWLSFLGQDIKLLLPCYAHLPFNSTPSAYLLPSLFFWLPCTLPSPITPCTPLFLLPSANLGYLLPPSTDEVRLVWPFVRQLLASRSYMWPSWRPQEGRVWPAAASQRVRLGMLRQQQEEEVKICWGGRGSGVQDSQKAEMVRSDRCVVELKSSLW